MQAFLNMIINKNVCEKNVGRANKKIIIGIIIICSITVLFYKKISLKESGEKIETVNLNVTNMKDTIPKVALTFDDGPASEYTKILLKGLKKRGVKVTFFLIGEQIQNNKALVKKMKKDGHLIGNHTYSHVDLAKTSYEEAKKEIEDTNNAIKEITGEMPKYLRPPYGDWNEKLLDETDMSIVLWSVDPEDWKDRNADIVAKRIIKNTRPGDIILLHDIFKTSVEAAFKIIDELQEKGYHFVTIDQIKSDKIIKVN
jgi:peptidoglycan/xylan/chitin deacetylase (PgdA/CDA1 family)